MPSLEWEDAGQPVVCGKLANDTAVDGFTNGGPHPIDPSFTVDDTGNMWLTLGSWSEYGDGAHEGARGGGGTLWGYEPRSTHGSR